MLAAFLLISAGAVCQQGASTGPAASKNDNAFPLTQSEAAAKAARPGDSSAPQPNAPTNPQDSASHSASPSKSHSASPSKGSTAQGNAFPEAQSKAAAKADSSGAARQPSSSSGYSSSDAGLPPDALGQGDSAPHAKMDTFARDQTEDGRIEGDLRVADLYMNQGNYRGALLRYQDALEYDPQNDTALYGVAEAMCKENRTAEAMARFKSYAKQNPQGKYAVKAEKMLAHPNKCTHNW
ncbi:MAG: tetratricopeptide repeat protein [Acidobacteriaceae bacterium]